MNPGTRRSRSGTFHCYSQWLTWGIWAFCLCNFGLCYVRGSGFQGDSSARVHGKVPLTGRLWLHWSLKASGQRKELKYLNANSLREPGLLLQDCRELTGFTGIPPSTSMPGKAMIFQWQQLQLSKSHSTKSFKPSPRYVDHPIRQPT